MGLRPTYSTHMYQLFRDTTRFRSTLDDEVLENPERREHTKALEQGKLQSDRTQGRCSHHDRKRRAAGAGDVDPDTGKGVGARLKLDRRSRLRGLEDRKSTRLNSSH